MDDGIDFNGHPNAGIRPFLVAMQLSGVTYARNP